MIGSNQRNNNCFKYLEQRKVSTGVDYTRNGRAAKITVDDSEVTQRLTTARSHYYPQIGAQREIMLSEVRGQDHSAGLFCRQLEAQRRGKHCYRTEITWGKGMGESEMSREEETPPSPPCVLSSWKSHPGACSHVSNPLVLSLGYSLESPGTFTKCSYLGFTTSSRF